MAWILSRHRGDQLPRAHAAQIGYPSAPGLVVRVPILAIDSIFKRAVLTSAMADGSDGTTDANTLKTMADDVSTHEDDGVEQGEHARRHLAVAAAEAVAVARAGCVRKGGQAHIPFEDSRPGMSREDGAERRDGAWTARKEGASRGDGAEHEEGAEMPRREDGQLHTLGADGEDGQASKLSASTTVSTKTTTCIDSVSSMPLTRKCASTKKPALRTLGTNMPRAYSLGEDGFLVLGRDELGLGEAVDKVAEQVINKNLH
ncbi:hypothetical protein T492DRAFT_839708 [Pavlovales sp. CCMP2436]|nr:hypothetical protein T492DRAFT_839708 [Pavlovales sp. CCMP2436]